MKLRRIVSSTALAICLALAALVQPVAARAQGQAEDMSARQILVMLRLPPAHFRPNSSYGGDYGGGFAQAARRRIAQAIARKNGLELVDGWPMPLIGVDCFVMRVPSGMSIEDAIARVSPEPMVEWSQPMHVYEARGATQRERDPLFAVQPAAASWHLAELHRIATGRGVTVAVIDSKIEIGHPDLAGQFVASRNFVGDRSNAAEQHGTGIAGVIAAKAGNGRGIAGIAPGARLMALRACAQSGTGAATGSTVCSSLNLAKALHYAIDRSAQVINLSLSGPPDLLLGRLIDIALSRRISVVAAFEPALPKGGFPASRPGVIAVADESLASLPTNVYGAPGRDVPTTQTGGKWHLVSGNSYAAAHVSGLIALMREHRKPVAAPVLVASRSTGGVIDACATLIRTSKACDCSCAVARQIAGTSHR